MPYIHQHLREQFDLLVLCIKNRIHANGWIKPAGLVNYTITKLLWDLCKITDGNGQDCNPAKGTYNYDLLNELIGALECCKLEFYRRITARYETLKMVENGDVVQPPATHTD